MVNWRLEDLYRQGLAPDDTDVELENCMAIQTLDVRSCGRD